MSEKRQQTVKISTNYQLTVKSSTKRHESGAKRKKLDETQKTSYFITVTGVKAYAMTVKHSRIRTVSPEHRFHALVLSLSMSFLKERFNLSRSLLWNLLRLVCDPFLGGDDEILLLGLCSEFWEVLELTLE